MKRFLLTVVVSLSACTPVNLKTDGMGHFINHNNEDVTVVGNPIVRCWDKDGNATEGILVRCNYDDSITIDLYGKGYKKIYRPDCELNPPDLR